MKITTIENIRQRFEWLQGVVDGRIKVSDSQLENIIDMRSFCNLEIPKLFNKISYNTLKNSCSQNLVSEISHNPDNQWEYIKTLRKKIYQTYTRSDSGSTAIHKPTEHLQMNEAFNHAQLAAIAYLDLFKFVKTIVESDSNLDAATKLQISNFLFESNQKFESVISFTTNSSKTWSVIQGGKGNA